MEEKKLTEENLILSIIIPTYNVEKYLDKCLSSFIVENFKYNFEVLIVNDGSTDNSAIIAEKYEKQHPEIFKYVEKVNGGHGSAINVGKEWAEGKYIFVVDSDDWVNTSAFPNLLEFLRNSDSDVVFSDYLTYNHKTGAESNVKVLKGEQQVNAGNISLSQVNGLATIHSVIFKKSIIEKMELQEHCYYDDIQYTIFPFLTAKTYAYTALNIYRYRINNSVQSVSIKNIYKHRLNLKTVLEKLVLFYNAKGYEIKDEAREYVFNGICKNILTNYNRYTYFILKDRKTKEEIVSFDNWLKSVNLPLYKSSGYESKGRYLIKIRKRHFNFVFPYGIAFWANKKFKKK